MKYIVCLKQVPETEGVKINPETGTLIREGVKSIINPYDLYALEAALQMKKQYGGEIIVLSMGPPQVEEALREAISYGADEAILLCDKAFAGADTLATSYTLAQAIKKIGNFDVIFCGKQAIDGETAQVGPELAQRLDIPYITYIRKIELKNNTLLVERLLDDGYQVVQINLPALLTVIKEIGEPPLPSIRGKMRAKKAKILLWTTQDIKADSEKIGLKGSATQVVKIFSPPSRGERQMLTGSLEQQARELKDKLMTIMGK
ncbi:electron transfer flavoprotein, beta subunit [Candidatus Desulfofervidus auxilii]|uniref:Protein FixA n=1 Tax=Desulfofervidus auxilii TaxID=1621989 RepID=A0A7U4QLZ5_DESA2|nr:electron transfer flavoprotein subunit beta/FixA family protein [Candidatus Desulfofervidus auxilii]AMM41781.1 electron transfer flavoprotein, beta subunit [Candidatus Desulfofervidus auxilii]CAD7780915.1 Caffeyl-CoA reductase-Etf complex subunit CarD [Candidatus Methanoperedenaceae archaeon GB37]CAD7782944.1 MAG: Caffeyl-CoA reductase-Etf complex subunit CarD [Candidatus Methanoperedenaceae archaeon GB37]